MKPGFTWLQGHGVSERARGKSEETPGQKKAIEAKTLLIAKSLQYLPRHFRSTDPVLEEVMSIFELLQVSSKMLVVKERSLGVPMNMGGFFNLWS